MFFVRFEDGTTVTELEFGDWDHVPKDRPLKSIGLILPLPGPGHLIPWEPLPEGCEKYYCARLGAAPLGGIDTWLGYILIGVMGPIFWEVKVRHDGFKTRQHPIKKLNIREEAWRQGLVQNDKGKT